jgi:hypothetical protein
MHGFVWRASLTLGTDEKEIELATPYNIRLLTNGCMATGRPDSFLSFFSREFFFSSNQQLRASPRRLFQPEIVRMRHLLHICVRLYVSIFYVTFHSFKS